MENKCTNTCHLVFTSQARFIKGIDVCNNLDFLLINLHNILVELMMIMMMIIKMLRFFIYVK